MSTPVAVVITGCERTEIVDQALEAAYSFEPMSEQAVAALLARTEKPAAGGDHEQFKTSTRFDGTGTHPEWLG